MSRPVPAAGSGRLSPSRSRSRRPLRPAAAGVLCAVLAAGGCTQAPSDEPGLPGPPSTSRATPFEGLTDRPADGPGTTFLLVGLDRRAGLSKEVKERLHVGGKECDCTDVMMLLHVSEDHGRVSVVSLPRDSYVEFAPHAERSDTGDTPVRHHGKINAAFQHGGPSLTVGTVERATGVRVDHYLETDFTGFVSTIDRLGGGTVCTDEPLRDLNSGLDLPAGTHEVDGRGALEYVRARHVPPPGDLGRVRRQQRFLVGLMEKLFDDRALADPAGLARTARALLASVRTDEGLTTGKLITLGKALRQLPSSNAEFATVPIADFDRRVPDWGSTLVWDKPRAEALFADLRADRSIVPETPPGETAPVPVAMAPAGVRVRVSAGPGAEPGSVARIARELRANGFTVVDGPSASARPAAVENSGPTEIRYDPALQRYAPTLAAALPDARLRPARGHGKVFEVTVGAEPGRVATVVHDRSSVEGAPVTVDELSCR
ncbi:MAG TPA: LytR family transcriptional regulator [Streptomyces sp.]|nr:LytR family transcriptional regulator [Streptomyces sp.]